MNLDSLQSDRAACVLVALAAGDALGAGYEFGQPLPDDAPVTMKGGGPFGFAPAEWTDDTSMAIAVAEAMLDAAGDGRDPVGDASLSAMVQRWVEWARTSKDVGAQTSSVLSSVDQVLRDQPELSAAGAAFAAASELHQRHGRSGGNGSLMRTGPVALCYLDAEPSVLFDAAAKVSALTHYDPDAGEACALWSLAIRHAVLTGELDIRVGLELLPSEQAALWLDRIEEAERSLPRDFDKNGWVVQAFQGAWSAIVSTADFAASPTHLSAALEACVRGGRDTDTVAAIAGGLLGAAYGYSAIPFEWRRRLHGWPGYRAGDLMRIGAQLARGRGRTPGSWPDLERFDNSGYIADDQTGVVVHPLDDGVLLGGAPALSRDDYDAVVSLSRVGTLDGARVPAEDRATFWLLDAAGTGANAHVEFVLQDAAEAVRQFRSEGKRVLLHCVRMESRTPTVAALYGSLVSGLTPLEALDRVREVLPNARPNEVFMEVLALASLPNEKTG